jgi:hypothetical protein
VPAAVAAGDGLVLVASVSSGSVVPAAPAGWTEVGRRVATGLTTVVWQRVAGAGDAGAAVRVTTSSALKWELSLLAYHGTAASGPVSAFASAAETVSRTTHTTPIVAVPANGSWVLSIWADKSSATTSLTPPASQTMRSSSIGVGGGRVSAVMTDGAAAVSAGTNAGGLVATSDAASKSDTMWTIVLNDS